MFYRVSLAAALLTAMVSSEASAFSCYRHVYNQSQAPWTVIGKGDKGNVWLNMESPSATCPSAGCSGGPDNSCVLPPGCVAQIQYTQTDGQGKGDVGFRDRTGNQQSWGYFFDTQCPRFGHSGGTGAVSLNEPANGDFSIGGNQW